MSNQMTLTYAELRALLVPVIPHAGTDDMLPVLTCIQVTTDHGWVVAQATDRFTVGFRRVRPATAPGDGFAMLLQATDAKRLVRLLRPARIARDTDTTEVSFTLTGTGEVHVSARSAGFALGFAAFDLELLLLDRNFPDLLGLLPSPEELRDTVPAGMFRSDLLARFATAATVCGDPGDGHRGLLLRMPAKPGRPMWVTVGADADFLGAVMPRRLARSSEFGAEPGITPAVIESWRPVKAKKSAVKVKPVGAGA